MLQRAAAVEAGLPVGVHRRIAGESIGEMRADSKKLAVDLGFAAPSRERDEGGRFSSSAEMSAQIRRAAGRAA